MKKILAFIMFLTSVFACASCRQNPYTNTSTQDDYRKSTIFFLSKSNEIKFSNDLTKEDFYRDTLMHLVLFDQTSPTNLFETKNGTQFAEVAKAHTGPTDILNIEKAYGCSFYIVNTNTNNQDITVNLKLEIKSDTGLSDAIRFMTYYEAGGAQNIKVYQKEDTDSNGNPIDYKYAAYDVLEQRNALVKFSKNTSTIFENEKLAISGAKGNNYLRYTVIYWVEGDDPNCNEDLLKKSAYFAFTFE